MSFCIIHNNKNLGIRILDIWYLAFVLSLMTKKLYSDDAEDDEQSFANKNLTLEGATKMPYVNIKITKEKVTAEEKALLIEGTTKLLVDILGKKPHETFVVIDEIDTDNWGLAGETVTKRRKEGK